MAEAVAGGEPALRIAIKNSKPVDVVDLAASLQALAGHYEDFVHSRGFDKQAGNA